jgi:hypothetical protein
MSTKSSVPEKNVLDGLRAHWETTFSLKPEMFGVEPLAASNPD